MSSKERGRADQGRAVGGETGGGAIVRNISSKQLTHRRPQVGDLRMASRLGRRQKGEKLHPSLELPC